jgi:DNA invertase Pin-like site-specific DNA recombinase
MSKAVGYCRISTLDQSHNSLEGQAEEIASYCKSHGLELVKTFTDNGKSAFTFDRPEWLQLETFIKKHKDVKFLVVKHLDRFSRANLMDALIKIDELENKLKVKVLTVSDPVDLNTDDLGVQILRSIGLLFSNNERQRIKERSKDGTQKSLRSGRFCNKAPIGYKNSKDTTGRPLLEIDYEKADQIRFIFRSYIQGMELEEIREAAKGVGFNQKGNSSIHRILGNPLYAGLVDVPAYKGKPGETIPGIHPPIISESDYWLVQRKLNSRHIVQQRSEDVPLRGVLHCHCGLKMTAGNSRSRSGKYYWYYLCRVHKKNYPAAQLHERFYQILDTVSIDERMLARLKERITEAIENSMDNKGGELMRAKLALQKIKTKIDNTQEKFLLQPDISSEVYSKVMTELKAEESRILTSLANLNSTGKALHDMLSNLLPHLNNLRFTFLQMELHRQHLLINTLFGYGLTYYDGVYRTPLIPKLFAHNQLTLKENGLLLVQPDIKTLEANPNRTPSGSAIEHSLEGLFELAKVFVA